MAYMHIDNLYKDPTILMFRECYALEKIHGTSAHVRWNPERNPNVFFFAGGVSHENFVKLFDTQDLKAAFQATVGDVPTVVYGEAYGGKCQRMSKVYGPSLRFVAFDVKINNLWLNVPEAETIVEELRLQFVSYRRIPATEEALNREREVPSVQAIRNGKGSWPEPREGIVIRPLVEMMTNNGKRVIAKHKTDAFAERVHPPKTLDPDELTLLHDAEQIAAEWVTPMRLMHVLDKLPAPYVMAQTGIVIKAVQVDIEREAASEVLMSREARKAIGRKTVSLFKARLAEGVQATLRRKQDG